MPYSSFSYRFSGHWYWTVIFFSGPSSSWWGHGKLYYNWCGARPLAFCKWWRSCPTWSRNITQLCREKARLDWWIIIINNQETGWWRACFIHTDKANLPPVAILIIENINHIYRSHIVLIILCMHASTACDIIDLDNGTTPSHHLVQRRPIIHWALCLIIM